jgi:hypothetical protein
MPTCAIPFSIHEQRWQRGSRGKFFTRQLNNLRWASLLMGVTGNANLFTIPVIKTAHKKNSEVKVWTIVNLKDWPKSKASKPDSFYDRYQKYTGKLLV